MGTSLIERDALAGNLLDRVDELERRIRYLEDTHPGIGGEVAGKLAYYREDGSLHLPGLLYSEENAVWGYYDRLAEQKSTTNATAGSNNLAHTTVPTGEVWKITMHAVINADHGVIIILRGTFGGVDMLVYNHGTPGAGVWHVSPPLDITVKAGDIVYAAFYDCTAGDDLYSNLFGYKMKVG